MSQLKVGDTVCFSSEGKFIFTNTPLNPHYRSGVVLCLQEEGLPIVVKWSNDWVNSYEEGHLEFTGDTHGKD